MTTRQVLMRLQLNENLKPRPIWTALWLTRRSRNTMLTMRQEQLVAFDREIRKTFGHHQITRLRTTFPNETAQLDDDSLSLRVMETIERAEHYEVVNEQDLEMFLDCTFMMAPDFDTDPNFSWAREILN